MVAITVEEFITDCELGLDIEFDCRGKSYTVLAWWKDGIAIGAQGTGAADNVFPTPDAVLDGFFIDGIPLRNIITEVQRTL